MSDIELSVVVVNWNSGSCVVDCLRSVMESAQTLATEIIVVDNNSQDGSPDLVITNFPEVRLIANETNIGFAAACNVGIKNSSGETLLFLNPDTVAKPNAIEKMYRFLQGKAEAGAVGGKLINRDGTPQIGFNVRSFPSLLVIAFELLLLNARFPRNLVNRRYRCLDADPNELRAVDQPAGACLMIKRSALDRVGLFDERFFPAWFEDVDLCRRIKAAGLKIFYYPDAEFLHLGGSSLRSLTHATFLNTYHRNLVRYFKKHHGLVSAMLVKLIILIGMLERSLIALFFPSVLRVSRSQALRAYLSVLVRCLFY